MAERRVIRLEDLRADARFLGYLIRETDEGLFIDIPAESRTFNPIAMNYRDTEEVLGELMSGLSYEEEEEAIVRSLRDEQGDERAH